jgi:hypothetical protein
MVWWGHCCQLGKHGVIGVDQQHVMDAIVCFVWELLLKEQRMGVGTAAACFSCLSSPVFCGTKNNCCMHLHGPVVAPVNATLA